MGIQHQVQRSDRVVSALIAGLEMEFGRGAAAALAERFLEAEAIDFHWNARRRERWLGIYDSLDDDDIELDRVAILGRLQGAWFVAICIVDGEGQVHGMTGKRAVDSWRAAERAFSDAR